MNRRRLSHALAREVEITIYGFALHHNMPLYVTLYKLTDQGRKTIRDSPKRAREIVTRIDKMAGHKVHHILYTTGRYDMVVVTEAPNDQAANAVALGIMAAGNVVGETLHAFTLDEIEKVVSRLP